MNDDDEEEEELETATDSAMANCYSGWCLLDDAREGVLEGHPDEDDGPTVVPVEVDALSHLAPAIQSGGSSGLTGLLTVPVQSCVS